jgi:hypothetical protein
VISNNQRRVVVALVDLDGLLASRRMDVEAIDCRVNLLHVLLDASTGLESMWAIRAVVDCLLLRRLQRYLSCRLSKWSAHTEGTREVCTFLRSLFVLLVLEDAGLVFLVEACCFLTPTGGEEAPRPKPPDIP